MKKIGAYFFGIGYLSLMAAVYYHTGGNLAATFYVSAATATAIGLLLFWRG